MVIVFGWVSLHLAVLLPHRGGGSGASAVELVRLCRSHLRHLYEKDLRWAAEDNLRRIVYMRIKDLSLRCIRLNNIYIYIALTHELKYKTKTIYDN